MITGSRMRADGTPSPLPTPVAAAKTPTGTPTAAASALDFAAINAAPSEADHVERLLASLLVHGMFTNAAVCPPTGLLRGPPSKPFGVSAAHFLAAPPSTDDDVETAPLSPLTDNNAFDLTYFTNAKGSDASSDGAQPVRDPTWFTNWVRCNFVPIYSLNPKENPHAEAVIADAITNPRNYVLKPQLEGGGNLYSGDEMVTLLRIAKPEGSEETLSEPQKEFLRTYWRVRNEYILMRRINVKKHGCDPINSTNAVADSNNDSDASPLFRMGQVISKAQVRAACVGINHQPNDDLCSELGIYGVILSEGPMPHSTPSGIGSIVEPSATTDGTTFSSVVAPQRVRVLLNDSAGYVIRSKLASVDDGGVMAGAAFLDSIALRN